MTHMTRNSFEYGNLGQGILSDRLEGLLDIDGLLGRSLKVGDFVLGVAPLLGAFGGHRAVVQVDLVAEHHEGEIVRITGTGLVRQN